MAKRLPMGQVRNWWNRKIVQGHFI
jgi:hypothetical protein